MIVSGFSGNEIYCLAQKGFGPAGIVVGNSVQSLGFGGSLVYGVGCIRTAVAYRLARWGLLRSPLFPVEPGPGAA